MIKNWRLILILVFVGLFLIAEIVFGGEADEEKILSNKSVAESVQSEDVPTPTPSEEPAPTSTPSPTPAVNEETLQFYDDVNESLLELQYGQLKLLISFWALVGLSIGLTVFRDLMK